MKVGKEAVALAAGGLDVWGSFGHGNLVFTMATGAAAVVGGLTPNSRNALRLCQRSEDCQCGEVRAEVAAVEGGEAVCLDAGVGGDEEIRDEVQAWSAVAPVAQEDLASEVSGRWGDGIINDVEAIPPGFPARLFA